MPGQNSSEWLDATVRHVTRTLRENGTYQMAAARRLYRHDAFDDVAAAAVPLVFESVGDMVAPYLVALRAAVSRAEYEDDRAELQELWDVLDSLQAFWSRGV